jgi:hypothetical protein
MNIGELFSPGQLIGKTFYVAKPIDFFRVDDINNFGDNARPITNKLKIGYSFVLDSFLLPREAGTGNYGFKYAKRSNPYFTFFGTDGKYYAVMFKNDKRFSLSKLKEQGAKSDVQLAAEKAEENKTPVDKLSDLFSSGAKTLKTLLFIGVGIYAAGYLIPKLRK